jgi:hypothetical protein
MQGCDSLIAIESLIIFSHRWMALPLQSRLPVLVISLILIALADARPIAVCSGGCQHSPIQNCIDAAIPGDIPEVQSGIYHENLNATQVARHLLRRLGVA